MAYTTSLSSQYNDTLTCTNASKPSVIEYSEGDLVDVSKEETISFLKGMKLILNDGSGSKSIVKFVGVDSCDGTQQKCKVLKDDGTITLVTQECLHFFGNPDIKEDLYGSTGLSTTRANTSNERIPNQLEDHGRNSVC